MSCVTSDPRSSWPMSAAAGGGVEIGEVGSGIVRSLSALVLRAASFYQLIRPQQQRRGDRQTQGLRRLHVHGEFQLHRSLDRKIRRALPFQDAIDIARGTARYSAEARCVGQKTTPFD